MALILLVYGSTGGNTEIAMEKIAEVLRANGHEPVLQRAECSKPLDCADFPVLVLGSPTYGHGTLEPNMDSFLRALSAKKTNEKGALFGKRCAVVGLGDAKYDPYYLIESATIMETFIQKEGGTLLLPSLRINKSPIPQLTGSILIWAEQLAKAIANFQ